MSFWCLQFLPKDERKQVDLRYHSSKVEFFFRFLGDIEDIKRHFEINRPLVRAVQLFQSEFVDGIGILQELFMNSSTRLSTRIPIGKAIVNIFTDMYML